MKEDEKDNKRANKIARAQLIIVILLHVLVVDSFVSGFSLGWIFFSKSLIFFCVFLLDSTKPFTEGS